MHKINKRGAVPIMVVYVLGALGLTQFIPNWRPSHWFEKGAPTKELIAAQEAAAKAKQDALEAEARFQVALAKQKAEQVSATQYSQQMIAGVPVALAGAQRSPEVVLASSLAERAGRGLSVAIGDLPQDKQSEITFIVQQALSAKQAEVDAAKAALAIKDKELADTKQAKQEVEAKLPGLQKQAELSDAKALAAQGLVAAKTSEVVAYADKAAAKEKEAGSLNAFAGTLVRWLIAIGIGYAIIHFVLPSLAQEFPAVRIITYANKTLKSIFSSHA